MSAAGDLLPREVTVLGECGPMVLHDPGAQAFFGLRPLDGSLLCASSDGRQMFVLRPQRDAGIPRRITKRALHAANLYEQFQGRRADGFYNCVVPEFRKPEFAGELVILRYTTQKKHAGDRHLVEYEHYFEEPFTRPAYARLFSVGHRQFWIAPGEWRVEADGVAYFASRSHLELDLGRTGWPVMH